MDQTPYPFGADGGPVDPRSPRCQSPQAGPEWNGDPVSCYLTIDSMAFRAWNRGIAATHGATVNSSYVVWLFNGTRWYPDPTFPGHAACPGNTVLWAGKLDYWVIGRRPQDPLAWPSLCRFDGSRFEWETLPVPASTLARLPTDAKGQPLSGAISAGTCLSWDNCWFFGSFGAMLHWDGENLNDATPGLGASPWLQGSFTAAVSGTDAAGNPFGFAVSDTSHSRAQGFQTGVPSTPDGSAPPQLWSYRNGGFSSLAFSPQTDALPDDPYRTDLIGVAPDGHGGLWVAGDPVGARPSLVGGPNPAFGTQTAPLTLLTTDGAPITCSGYDHFTFRWTPGAVVNSFAWNTLAAFQATGDALAGGSVVTPKTGTNPNNNKPSEPVIVVGECGRAPLLTRFRIPDPFNDGQDPDNNPVALIPADVGGYTTAVVANAANDAWAATTGGGAQGPGGVRAERPHLYRLTDGQSPDAPAGDDKETRPVVFIADPIQYVVSPPVTITKKPKPKVVTHRKKPKRVHVKAAIYGIHVRLTYNKATRSDFVLHIIFRVRRTVTVGAVGLVGGRVVTMSGMRRFGQGVGELRLRLDPRHWPKAIKFVLPKPKK